MKKGLLLFVLGSLMAAQAVYSQVKPFRFGLKVAPNIGWISPDSQGYENEGTEPGFSWGFIADITITENYFFGTGFNTNYISGKLSYPHQQYIDEDTIPTLGVLERKYNLRYLDIPLTLKMKTSKFNQAQFFGQIGFSLGINLKAKAKDDFTYEVQNGSSETVSTEGNISDDVTFAKGSLLLSGGVEYYIDNSTSLLFGITFLNGLSNILTGDNSVDPMISEKAVPHYLEITLGVIF